MSRSSPSSLREPEEASGFEVLFAGLAGRWRLRRRISNGARFDGTAEFAAQCDGSLKLTETGWMRLPHTQPVQAFREWRWLLSETGELEIRYPPESGGGEYHRLRARQGTGSRVQKWRGEAIHPCGEDVYRGFYSLRPGRLFIGHHVTGPAKNYRIASLYLR